MIFIKWNLFTLGEVMTYILVIIIINIIILWCLCWFMWGPGLYICYSLYLGIEEQVIMQLSINFVVNHSFIYVPFNTLITCLLFPIQIAVSNYYLINSLYRPKSLVIWNLALAVNAKGIFWYLRIHISNVFGSFKLWSFQLNILIW